MNGFVYVFKAMGTDRYKIGMTLRHTSERRKELNGKQTPFPIFNFLNFKTGNPKRLEKQFHQALTEYRKHGEWFEFKESRLLEIMKILDSIYTQEHQPNIKLRNYISGIKTIKFTK